MSYNLSLAERVREILGSKTGLVEKQMFGGICFLLNGHMCCGVVKDQLVVRVGPDDYDRAIAEPDARPMDFTGRSLRGFVYVTPPSTGTRKTMEAWVGRALQYVNSLPSKAQRQVKRSKMRARRKESRA